MCIRDSNTTKPASVWRDTGAKKPTAGSLASVTQTMFAAGTDGASASTAPNAVSTAIPTRRHGDRALSSRSIGGDIVGPRDGRRWEAWVFMDRGGCELGLSGRMRTRSPAADADRNH